MKHVVSCQTNFLWHYYHHVSNDFCVKAECATDKMNDIALEDSAEKAKFEGSTVKSNSWNLIMVRTSKCLREIQRIEIDTGLCMLAIATESRKNGLQTRWFLTLVMSSICKGSIQVSEYRWNSKVWMSVKEVAWTGSRWSEHFTQSNCRLREPKSCPISAASEAIWNHQG